MVGNCGNCGNLGFLIRGLCEKCLSIENQEFDLLKKLIEEDSSLGVEELTEKSGLKPERILSFIREGRLTMKSGVALACSSCGKPIASGRLCADCLRRLGSITIPSGKGGGGGEGMYTRRK